MAKVLIVDDDNSQCMSLGFAFSAEGFTVEMATSGRRAIDIGTREIRRQKIGRKLNPVKLAFNHISQRFYSPGLSQARRAFNENMTIT